LATRICLIEDDETLGEALSMRFELEGLPCDWHKTGKSAFQALENTPYSAVVSDILLPDIRGDVLYERLLESRGKLPPFIFMTGHGSVAQAVGLLKLGAVDYLLKPFQPDHLLGMLRELIATQAGDRSEFNNPLGISPAMQSLDALLLRLANSQASVLITGESGVGKELVATKLHRLRGGNSPFIAANCGAFSESLLEAELFGYERGAFTGAIKAKKGLFEQACGGTLLLDEIGDMPLTMQVKVLRAIQERQIVRIGGEQPVAVDFRLMAATHLDLKARVEEGLFREDLYYRVNVIQIRVPPLRERRDDILWLAGRFLDQACQNGDMRRKIFTPAAERALLDYSWPGNVRELKHMMERACVLAEGPLLTPDLLFGAIASSHDPVLAATLGDHLAAHERDYILRALDARAWQIQETANLLGISRKNLWEKMKKHAISSEREPLKSEQSV
jgi:DNA-binding NtrC family response regulator